MSDHLRFLDDPTFRPLSRAQRAVQRATGRSPVLGTPLLPVPRMGSREQVRAYLSYLDNPRYRAVPSSVPPSPRAETPSAGHALPPSAGVPSATVPDDLPPAVRDTLRLAQQRHPDLWSLDNGMLFRRHFQQLLPLKRDVVLDWGAVSLQNVADLANRVAVLTRAHVDLRGLDVLQKLLDDLRRPKNLWERMTRGDATFTATRTHLGSLRTQVKPLLEQCDDLEKDAHAAEQRLAVLLASFGVVAATAAGADGKLLQAIEERSNLLQLSLRQAAMLPPQVRALGTQMTDLLARVDEALNVTLPAIELAHASRLTPARGAGR